MVILMSQIHKLPATPHTVHWGYYDKSWQPALVVKSGDIVEIEAICHQSGDAPELLMDEAITAIYDAFPDRNMGDHIVTGPIYIEGAEPGDVLEAKILDLQPRMPHGSNVLANWGELADAFDQTEYIYIYKINDDGVTASPEFMYTYPGKIEKPGQIRHEHEVERITVTDAIKVPLNLHFGIAGVTPKETGKVDTTHPKYFGGNVDNKNFVAGTSMYYEVNNPGAGFYVGDSHFAQGDAELSGTAIEGSVNGRIQLILHKDMKLKENPILETDTHWMVHGFDADLDKATHQAALEGVEFLAKHYAVSRTLAYSILSVHADFHISQVANGVKGVHCRIRKDIFQ